MLAITDNADGSMQDRQLPPIALQRWESDGGAVPAWRMKPMEGSSREFS
jgi:hypothetical protein